MSKITYTNKVTLNENPNVADINKVKADDLTEIKNVVNANDDNVRDLADLQTEDVSSIVNAINENVQNTEQINNKFLLNNYKVYSSNQMTTAGPSIGSSSFIRCHHNTNGSVGRISGFINVTTGGTSGSVAIPDCGLRPSKNIVYRAGAIITSSSGSWYGNIKIETSGILYVMMQNIGQQQVNIIIFPAILFMNEYEDEA